MDLVTVVDRNTTLTILPPEPTDDKHAFNRPATIVMAATEAPPDYDSSSSSPTFVSGEHTTRVKPVPLEPVTFKYESPTRGVARPTVESAPWLERAHVSPSMLRYSQTAHFDPSAVLDRFPATNRITVFSGKDPIRGTYVIDPQLMTLHSTNMFIKHKHMRTQRILHGAEMSNVRGAGREQDGWSWDQAIKRVNDRTLSAAFTSRRGPISLDLIIAATVRGSWSAVPDGRWPAPISVTTKQGDIALTVVCRDADLNTWRNILVLMPRSYSGTITLRTGRDITKENACFLPKLSQEVRVLRKSVREVVASFRAPNAGQQPQQSSSEQQIPSQDYCMVTSKRGRIAVGLWGLDEAVGWDRQRIELHGRRESGANFYL
ncbi:uncharacterized protein BXZ73DRAFT_99749 [Epithele typhae]|uniref:uncharacterized protein n=1 Tax=Epithele typhae TaxID=378194 RepID=UPI002007D2C9|nr:uncharacterized protein BXZ73DRAFT_99749 [Epithele typhae]KAH9939072.1 hypothetical protein BXZ73DRAFT_99749 [Epithele typhae]